MLARQLVRFKCFDLTNVPKARRTAALKQEIESWTPFVESGCHIFWRGNLAYVWCWDAELVRLAQAEAGLKSRQLSALPETVIQDPPSGVPLRLLALRDGFEGQVWVDGALHYSRWWGQVPGVAEWANFQRDASLRPEQRLIDLPEPQVVPEQPAPVFPDQGIAGFRAHVQQFRQIGMAMLIFAFLLPSGWLGSQWLKLRQGFGEQRQALAEAERRAGPLRQARAQAQDDLVKIRELRDFNPYPTQVELMAAVATLLPKTGLTLKDWRYQQGKLKLTLALAGPVPASELITVLQSDGTFANVTAVTDAEGKSVALQMDVAER